MQVVGRSSAPGALDTFAPSLYLYPPRDRVPLDKFESWAMDRLSALYELDRREVSGALDSEDIHAICKKYGLYTPRNDIYSHFTLRLAFCKTEELRRWLIRVETRLFRARFEAATTEDKAKFLKENNLHMKPVSEKELVKLRDQIFFFVSGNNQQLMNDSVYKVPFELALDLVARRRVFVHQGEAFVPFSQVVSIVAAKFRSHLSNELSLAFRASFRSNTLLDERIEPLLTALRSNQLLDNSYKAAAASGSVSLAQLDVVSLVPG